MTQTVFVRNTQSGPTVYDDDGLRLVWQGAGDPNHEDIQPIPAEALDSYNFQRALYLGVLKIEDADEKTRRAATAHRKSWEKQMGVRAQGLEGLQADAEPGSCPREPITGPGHLPQTVEIELGVRTKGGTATAERERIPVVVSPRGSYV
jgi:hypothetical protein